MTELHCYRIVIEYSAPAGEDYRQLNRRIASRLHAELCNGALPVPDASDLRVYHESGPAPLPYPRITQSGERKKQ